jgi:hypothetical protein
MRTVSEPTAAPANLQENSLRLISLSSQGPSRFPSKDQWESDGSEPESFLLEMGRMPSQDSGSVKNLFL